MIDELIQKLKNLSEEVEQQIILQSTNLTKSADLGRLQRVRKHIQESIAELLEVRD